MSGTLGTDIAAAAFTAGTISTKSIASNSWTIGAAVGNAGVVTLPTLTVNAVTGTIGASTYSVGAASIVQESIATAGSAPATIGAITASGSGSLSITLGATNTATVAATGANAQGAISAAGMTSSQSAFTLNASAAISALSVTGGSGVDTITLNNTPTVVDTITGGAGNDVITLGATGGAGGGSDIVVLSVGSSTPTMSGGNGTTVGGDDIRAFGAAGTTDKIQINVTSADQAWDIATHVLVGTGPVGGNQLVGSVAAYSVTSYLVQVGNPDSTADAFDIAAAVTSTVTGKAGTASFASNAEAQAGTVVNLTGTAFADTLTTGANNDTISGGSGNDSITGGAGADSIDVGSGTGTLGTDRVIQAAVGNSGTYAAPGTNTIAATTFDVITNFTAGDVLALAAYTGTAAGTAANSVLVNTIAAKAATLVASTVAANTVLTVQGTYTPATLLAASSFVGSASGSDLMVIYDGDATLATTAIEAVVIVGGGSLTATVTAGAGGLIGFA